jgi:anthranilate synthase
MITVTRKESAASAHDVEKLLSSLESQPGLWMGCDVASDGLFRKESMACAVPALRFCLDGDVLTVTAMSAVGGALLPRVGELAAFQGSGGSRWAVMASGGDVVSVLRRTLELFQPVSAELALFGAFAFDYYHLGTREALPADGRRRLVVYLPEKVLVARSPGSRWVEFVFSTGATGEAGIVEAACVQDSRDELSPGAHAGRVASGVEKLRRGELQSLVLSQAFRRRTGAAPAQAFSALRARNPYPAMFFCNLGGGEILFGASPDLQVRADATWVESAPVCGTLRRGRDPVEDMDQVFALLASDKEGAAIALCADSAANELALVCEPGSVEVCSHRRPYFFSTIIHAIDHLRGRRRGGLDAFDLLLAHATPATVTGLPKAAAVRAISELEADWRGWYAGAVARLGSDGSLEAYTILRAARVAGGVAEIRTGGNILVDSEPAKEEEESELKAQTLFHVLEAGARKSHNAETPLRLPSCRILASDDEAALLLRNALVAAGARPTNEADLGVLSGVPSQGDIGRATLAVGTGALWLLEREGAPITILERPEYARRVAGRASPGGFLAVLDRFEAGWYASRAVRSGALPYDWLESAVSEDGWVLAAENRSRPACALMFRPDSVLSLHRDVGKRSLEAALEWLDHAMFAPKSKKEEIR